MKNMKISIIGGGIGGLATCLALSRAGIDATVYERAPELKEIGAGISLWANAARVLKKLGLLDTVLQHSERIDFIHVKSKQGAIIKRIRVNHYEVPAVCIHRATLLEILREAIEPERITLGKTFERYEQKADRVTAHFADGSQIESDAIIGADGLKSAVRAQLKGSAPPVFRGYTVWRGIADYAPKNYERCTASETWSAGQRIGITGIGNGRFYWYATDNQPENNISSPAERKQHLLELFKNWHEPIPQFIRATDEEHILQNDCYDREPNKGWSDGKVLLIGDAAHPTTPNMGQGGCMALEDSIVLTKCLQNETSIESAFRRFENERFPRTQFITKRSRQFGQIGQWQNPISTILRNSLLRVYPARLFELEQKSIHGFEA
jgi:2-polyprenyl-6-methoxyphenol hydroxylase-like FAD-dependent oxidoreductase